MPWCHLDCENSFWLLLQEAPILVVGTSAGAVMVLRLTGPLSHIDGVDNDLQSKNLEAAVKANMSVTGSAAK